MARVRFGEFAATTVAALLMFTPMALGADGATSLPAAAASPAIEARHPSGDEAANASKGLAGRAIDSVKTVAGAATDAINRVPCRSPKGGAQAMGSFPRVAGRLAAGEPVTIVAFGSSSTQGHGASSPKFNYPNRLEAQLQRRYPDASITMINSGKGGEDAPEMLLRLKSTVIDHRPDLVIWQVGTNAVLRNLDPQHTVDLVDEGIKKIKAVGADVVLVDPQYSPATVERPEASGRMVSLLDRLAKVRKVGLFPRYEIMQEWHEEQALAFSVFVINDGLHLNDWGYACFAQLLGDNIIKTVGEINSGQKKASLTDAPPPVPSASGY